MKTVFALALTAVLAFPVAVRADDHEDKAETTVDTTHNPITGTTTTTKKTKKKMKRGDAHAKVEVTEKTKKHKDGEVEKSVDVEGDSTTGDHK